MPDQQTSKFQGIKVHPEFPKISTLANSFPLQNKFLRRPEKRLSYQALEARKQSLLATCRSATQFQAMDASSSHYLSQTQTAPFSNRQHLESRSMAVANHHNQARVAIQPPQKQKRPKDNRSIHNSSAQSSHNSNHNLSMATLLQQSPNPRELEWLKITQQLATLRRCHAEILHYPNKKQNALQTKNAQGKQSIVRTSSVKNIGKCGSSLQLIPPESATLQQNGISNYEEEMVDEEQIEDDEQEGRVRARSMHIGSRDFEMRNQVTTNQPQLKDLGENLDREHKQILIQLNKSPSQKIGQSDMRKQVVFNEFTPGSCKVALSQTQKFGQSLYKVRGSVTNENTSTIPCDVYSIRSIQNNIRTEDGSPFSGTMRTKAHQFNRIEEDQGESLGGQDYQSQMLNTCGSPFLMVNKDSSSINGPNSNCSTNENRHFLPENVPQTLEDELSPMTQGHTTSSPRRNNSHSPTAKRHGAKLLQRTSVQNSSKPLFNNSNFNRQSIPAVHHVPLVRVTAPLPIQPVPFKANNIDDLYSTDIQTPSGISHLTIYRKKTLGDLHVLGQYSALEVHQSPKSSANIQRAHLHSTFGARSQSNIENVQSSSRVHVEREQPLREAANKEFQLQEIQDKNEKLKQLIHKAMQERENLKLQQSILLNANRKLRMQVNFVEQFPF
ncbi:hypothetical protein FGO68_gene7644 [Halteria grandinella]|uniref:Uncharacterized protein n=1 Tax=Halteria grandinella TaxID=5974 RepID=A0A8J8T5W7_HALGN|nr:hypothetical protein FGO68_gene7644 [Halteria grandinella]